MDVKEVLARFEEEHQQHKPEIRIIRADTPFLLMSALSSQLIDWTEWINLPGAKRLENLLKEIKDGESKLGFNDKGELIREVSKAVIDVVYTRKDGVQMRLFEEFYENGHWISREPKGKVLKRGVQEKKLRKETFREAALRGLKEEMRITDLTSEEEQKLVHLFNSTDDRISKGFPGLKTNYYYSDFVFDLPDRFYRPEYPVQEAGFKTRLVWEKIQ